MELIDDLTMEIDRMKEGGKSPDEILVRSREIIESHNRRTWMHLFFQALLDGTVVR